MFTQQRAPTSPAPIGPLARLAIRTQSLTVINDAIEKGNGRQASLPQTTRPLVYSLCQKFLIMVPGTPGSAGFQFSQLGTGYFSHDAINYLVRQDSGFHTVGQDSQRGP